MLGYYRALVRIDRDRRADRLEELGTAFAGDKSAGKRLMDFIKRLRKR